MSVDNLSLASVAERLIDGRDQMVEGLAHVSQGRTEALLLLQHREGETRKQFLERAAAGAAAVHARAMIELDRMRADASAAG